MKWFKRKVTLRPALPLDQLRAGLRSLEIDFGKEAVLHILEARAVDLTEQAGLPGIPSDEAKALARSAAEFRQLYGELSEMIDKAKSVKKRTAEPQNGRANRRTAE